MFINGKVREIGELRQVQFPDETKFTRSIVIDFLGTLYADKVTGADMQKQQTIVLDVWGKQATDPKYKVNDIVDVIFESNASNKEGRWFNNLRVRVILAPFRD